MTARTHDLAAITALGIIIFSVPPQEISFGTFLLALLANQIGGIMPDIDQPTAPFWRNLPIGGFIGRGIGKMLGGHRFLTHSILGAAVIGVLSYMLLEFLHPLLPTANVNVIWLAFMVGLISHLIMDSFTEEGVPWLLPIPIKFGFPPIKKWRIVTGKSAEKFLFVALIGFDVWFCATHYSQLVAIFKNYLA